MARSIIMTTPASQTDKPKTRVLQIPLRDDVVWNRLREMADRAHLPLATFMRVNVLIPLTEGRIVSTQTADDLLARAPLTIYNYPENEDGTPNLEIIPEEDRARLKKEWRAQGMRKVNPFTTEQEREELMAVAGLDGHME